MSDSKGAVLLTGATGGIGRLAADKLASLGFTVYAAARSPDVRATDANRPSSGPIVPLVLDVTDDASIHQAAGHLESLLGPRGLAGLINNAGIIVKGPLDLVSPEDFRRQFDVNVTGPFALTRAMLPLLRRGGGRVINIGASSARTAVPFFGAISASKAAMASLSDAMRMEFAPLGVRVVLIEPGAIATSIHETSAKLHEKSLGLEPPEKVAFYAKASAAVKEAMRKSPVDKPEVVANAIVAALTERRPKPRLLVGKGSGQLAFLRHLPISLRDRLLTSSLGIAKPLAAAQASVVQSASGGQ